MAKHWALKSFYIFLGGIGFYLITGAGALAIFLMVLVALLEFRYATPDPKLG